MDQKPSKQARAAFSTTTSVFSILFITFCVVSIALSFMFSRTLFRFLFSSEKFQITSIVQHATSEDVLPTELIAEVLDLSKDHPVNLYSVDAKELSRRLMAISAIKRARVERRSPDQLYVEYELREPFAKAIDYENSYVDEEGILFAAHPFFTPKKLPEIYFGDAKGRAEVWGSLVDSQKMARAVSLIHVLKKERIKMIDLSRLNESSLGTREIIVVLHAGNILRLNERVLLSQLKNYAYLKKIYLKEKKSAYIVDLRLPNTAYLEPL